MITSSNRLQVMGFTGTQQGMTVAQQTRFGELILQARVLHHGDCIGADCHAHIIAVYWNRSVVIHPPIIDAKRAHCERYCSEGTNIEVRQPFDYHKRNHHIVIETDALIACPSGPERIRSGTWSTVRYARGQHKPVIIIMPDGSVINE